MLPTYRKSNTALAIFSFVALGLSCGAAPGLSPFGPWEIALVTVLGLFFVGGFLCQPAVDVGHDRKRRALKVATAIYAIVFAQSAILGLAVGNGLIDSARAVLPYIGIIIVLVPWWLRRVPLTCKSLNSHIILVGFGQAIFTLLVFRSNTFSLDPATMLSSRVTQFDSRLTMPFTIAAAVVAFVRMAFARRYSMWQFVYLGLAGLCVTAGFVTQTRSQVLSVIFGVIIACILGLFFSRSAVRERSRNSVRRLRFIAPVSVSFAAILFSSTDFGSALLDTMVLRNTAVGDGRIEYEIIPVLDLYIESGIPVWLLGIGAGTPFVDGLYESRTYLHNLPLYALIYCGAIGAFFVLYLWWTFANNLKSLWQKESDPEWLALLAVMSSLFCFAQFFAVHKTVPFNLILWLAVTCVFSHLRSPDAAHRLGKTFASNGRALPPEDWTIRG